MRILRKAVLAGAICAIFAGPAAAEGFGSATFQALVGPTGVVARGSGVKAVTHQSVGRYLVQFTRLVNQSACVYTATPFGAYGGQASIQVVPGKPDTIAVFMFSKAGVPANLYFNLLVSCNSVGVQALGTAIMSASVRSDGLLLAGAGVLSSSYNSTGKEYTVTFNRSILGCSSIATPAWETAVAMVYEQNPYDGILRIVLTNHTGSDFPHTAQVARNFYLIVFCPT